MYNILFIFVQHMIYIVCLHNNNNNNIYTLMAAVTQHNSTSWALSTHNCVSSYMSHIYHIHGQVPQEKAWACLAGFSYTTHLGCWAWHSGGTSAGVLSSCIWCLREDHLEGITNTIPGQWLGQSHEQELKLCMQYTCTLLCIYASGSDDHVFNNCSSYRFVQLILTIIII